MSKARPRRKVTTVESLSPLEQFVRRLSVLGATVDEIEAVVATWDDLDDDWTERDRDRFARAPDPVIREQLDAVRRELHEHTTTPDADAQAESARAYRALLDEAAVKVTGTVAHVLGWVNEVDGYARNDRAGAALAAELTGKQRATLLDPLRAMLDHAPGAV